MNLNYFIPSKETRVEIKKGDAVKVKVLDTDIERCQIEMEWVEGSSIATHDYKVLNMLS